MNTYRGGSSVKQLNIQDYFLNTARKEKMNVVVFLTNGFQLKGVIKGFDNFTILLESDGKQLLFRHTRLLLSRKTINK